MSKGYSVAMICHMQSIEFGYSYGNPGLCKLTRLRVGDSLFWTFNPQKSEKIRPKSLSPKNSHR